jgi:hypothetical protein
MSGRTSIAPQDGSDVRGHTGEQVAPSRLSGRRLLRAHRLRNLDDRADRDVSRIADLFAEMLGANAENNRLALIGSGQVSSLPRRGTVKAFCWASSTKVRPPLSFFWKLCERGDTRIRLSLRIIYGTTICLALRQASPPATNLPVQESM